jgi:hypothetical protein
MVAAAIRTVFAQPDADHVTEQFDAIATMLGRQLPKVEQQMRDAKRTRAVCRCGDELIREASESALR